MASRDSSRSGRELSPRRGRLYSPTRSLKRKRASTTRPSRAPASRRHVDGDQSLSKPRRRSSPLKLKGFKWPAKKVKGREKMPARNDDGQDRDAEVFSDNSSAQTASGSDLEVEPKRRRSTLSSLIESVKRTVFLSSRRKDSAVDDDDNDDDAGNVVGPEFEVCNHSCRHHRPGIFAEQPDGNQMLHFDAACEPFAHEGMMRFQNRSNDRLAYVDGPSSFWQREGYVKCQCIFKPESPYCDSPTRTLAPSAPEHAITPNQLTNAEAGVTDEPYRWRGLSGWSPRPSTARSRAERRRQLSSSFKSNWPRSPSPSSRTRSSLLQPSLFPTSMLSSVSNGPDLSLPLSLDQIGVLPEADKEEAVEVTPESAETMHTIQHSSRRSFTISLNPSAGNAAHRWNSPLPSLTPSPPPPPRRNSVRPGTAVSGTTQHTVDDADAEAEDLALMRMGGMADALDSYKVDDDDDDKTRPTRPVSPDRESRKGRERGRSTTRRRRRGVTMS